MHSKNLGTGWSQQSVSRLAMAAFMVSLLLIPELAFAQAPAGGAFTGITTLIKSIANLLIYEWGTT